MSNNTTDYDKIIKDHLRMRLMESGWNDEFHKLIQNAIHKRVENGQTLKDIKFEQMYNDVIDHARDAISNELEIEFHEKVEKYLMSNQDKNNETPNLSENSPVIPSDVSLDIPSDVISNDNSWMEPECSYYE